MKRRKIVGGAAGLLAAPFILRQSPFSPGVARADAVADPARLTQDLTPLGAERAGSKSGLIPAWTGGAHTPPADWAPDKLPPDLFAGQKPVFTVTKDNMAQYAHMLSAGQVEMLKRYGGKGYRMDVYPCERTACAPDYVYKNTALNVTRSKFAPGGVRYGVANAIGGIPYPILDPDPAVAGAQAIWNHQLRWGGYEWFNVPSAYVVSNGNRVLTSSGKSYTRISYYEPGVDVENFSGFYYINWEEYVAPPPIAGGKFMAAFTLQPKEHPDQAWEYLVGEGRIRQLPAFEYDSPITQYNDAADADEAFGFIGALDRYEWKLVGKKEMIVPYNQASLYRARPQDAMLSDFVNPDLIRHEVHRCWVVEATLAPGARMSEPFRRFYLDEDTWMIMLTDGYDDQKNYWRFSYNTNAARPDLPGTIYQGQIICNLQQQEYVFAQPLFNAPFPQNGNWVFKSLPNSMFQPQSMVDSGGL